MRNVFCIILSHHTTFVTLLWHINIFSEGDTFFKINFYIKSFINYLSSSLSFDSLWSHCTTIAPPIFINWAQNDWSIFPISSFLINISQFLCLCSDQHMAANISIVRDSFTLTTLSHLYNFKSHLFGMLTFGNKCLQLTCRFKKKSVCMLASGCSEVLESSPVQLQWAKKCRGSWRVNSLLS